MSVDLERELGTRLRQSSTAAPVGDGWEAIHRRIDARHRSRQRRRLAGCGVALVVTAVASAALLTGRGSETRVATRPPASPSTEPELPRLVLDVPGWRVERAATAEAPGRPIVGEPLWSFTEPGRGVDGKVVFATVARPSTPFGIGDQSPTATEVDIRGRTGYLTVTPPLVGQLGWRLADGTVVYLTSARLSGDELVAFARALDVTADRTLIVPAGPLPAGLALLRAATPGEWDAGQAAEVSYGRRDARLELRLQTGGEWLLDDLVRDRLASAAAARAVTVHGQPGVLSTYQGAGDSHAVIWSPAPGVVAEVRADGVPVDEALAAARSAKEVDEDAWRELVARFPVEPSPPAAPPATASDRHHEVLSDLCRLRGAWLAADGAGEATRADLVDRVRELRATAVAERLDRDSDIVVVLDDLLQAMQAGDTEAVRSIPGGGCA